PRHLRRERRGEGGACASRCARRPCIDVHRHDLWSELMKPKKPIPKAAVLGIIAAGGLLVLVAGWLLVVSPQKHKAANLKEQTTAVRQKISDELAQAAVAKSATSVPTIKVADVYRLAKAMPSINDM